MKLATEEKFLDAHATLAALSALMWGRTDSCDPPSEQETIHIGRSLTRATEAAHEAFYELAHEKHEAAKEVQP